MQCNAMVTIALIFATNEVKQFENVIYDYLQIFVLLRVSSFKWKSTNKYREKPFWFKVDISHSTVFIFNTGRQIESLICIGSFGFLSCCICA